MDTIQSDMASITSVTTCHAAMLMLCAHCVFECVCGWVCRVAVPLDIPCAFSLSQPINLLITFKRFAN